MPGREGVLDEPLIVTLDEPPIGNAACPQTPSNPDAVVLGGVQDTKNRNFFMFFRSWGTPTCGNRAPSGRGRQVKRWYL